MWFAISEAGQPAASAAGYELAAAPQAHIQPQPGVHTRRAVAFARCSVDLGDDRGRLLIGAAAPRGRGGPLVETRRRRPAPCRPPRRGIPSAARSRPAGALFWADLPGRKNAAARRRISFGVSSRRLSRCNATSPARSSLARPSLRPSPASVRASQLRRHDSLIPRPSRPARPSPAPAR
jgi:hypothetical protein